jgi:single-strand DNA-binding protein|tara:strand:- start:3314 stop:3727 length:414 start_codon:yes stop_codon:yes gene_type:complete
MDLNKVSLIGNLGKEPEVRSFQNGGQVCNFSLATTRKWKNKDGEPGEKTEWHNVVVRDKNLVVVAERFLTKGTRIYLEGRIEQRQYEQEGTTKYISEVVLAPFEGRLHIEARGKGWRDTEDTQSVKLDDDLEDDIPF